MGSIKRFEEIIAWQKARVLVNEVYRVCATGHLNRDFSLRDQIRRAAVSTMTNIAEGFGRKTDGDFAHFLDVARGSALEVESSLYIARDLEYIQQSEFEKIYQLSEETISLLSGLTSYLRKQPMTNSRR
jgi:four helix bundle protein